MWDDNQAQPEPGDGAYTCARCGKPTDTAFDDGFLESPYTEVYCSQACADG